MLKAAALIIVAILGVGNAQAEELSQPSPASPVVASGEVMDSKPAALAGGAAAAPDCGGKARQRAPRKDYPNVMGMSLTTWLASRQPGLAPGVGADG